MKLQLIRHGMTEANEKTLFCGMTDLPLSENGLRQLNQLSYETVPGSMYITSSLKRSIQTMEALFGRQPDIILEELNEMNFGDFEMKAYSELKNNPDFIHWMNGYLTVSCPNGESWNMFADRVERGLEKLLQISQLKSENLVVVSHGGVIAAIMEKLFPSDTNAINQKNFYRWHPGNGMGYAIELKVENGNCKVEGDLRFQHVSKKGVFVDKFLIDNMPKIP